MFLPRSVQALQAESREWCTNTSTLEPTKKGDMASTSIIHIHADSAHTFLLIHPNGSKKYTAAGRTADIAAPSPHVSP